jgi:hypothetical protein
MPKSLKMLEFQEILIVHARLKKVRDDNKNIHQEDVGIVKVLPYCGSKGLDFTFFVKKIM